MRDNIFQDIYEWVGQSRKLNIYKEEPVLGRISIDYSDMLSVSKDAEDILCVMRGKSWDDMNKHEAAVQFSDSLAKIWRVHPFREGNTRTIITFCCQYADEIGLNPKRDLSKKEYLLKIVEDAVTGG